MIRYRNSNDLMRAIDEGELGEGGICILDERDEELKLKIGGEDGN